MVRAALARGAAWPRTGADLAALVAAACGRVDAHWVPHPEDALIQALKGRTHGPIAAPAWGVAAFAAPLGDSVVWMPPAPGRLDPGPDEVAAALDAGATAVLHAPVAGDCATVHAIATLCSERGVPLALDARMASGGRVLDGPPGAWGDVALLAVHGEPGPAPCPGAVLVGAATAAANGVDSASSLGHSLALLRDAVGSEPRVRRISRSPGCTTVRARQEGAAPSWAFAAAAARLQQSAERASQRARHARTLRANLAHVEGVTVIEEPTGVQSASCVLPLLADHRDAIAAHLAEAGIPTLQTLGGWLSRDDRPDRATHVAEHALLLPLHPFYRPDDLVFIGEELRRGALRAGT